MAVTLLTIPQEIRDLIYCYILEPSRPPPLDPDHAGDRSKIIPMTRNGVYYEAKPPRYPLSQLKRSCRQICSEISLLETDTFSSQVAEMDVMIRDTSIWPTWTHLPITALQNNRIPTLHITLRTWRTEWQGAAIFSASTPRTLWQFVDVITGHGPRLIHRQVLEQPIDIEKLVLDIKPMDMPLLPIRSLYERYFTQVKAMAADGIHTGRVKTVELRSESYSKEWQLARVHCDV